MAFVSSVYNFDDQSPSVIEILVFWLISAMGLPGGWKIPEVGSEVTPSTQEIPCSVYDIMAHHPDAALALSVI
jgi:hypothetical protein